MKTLYNQDENDFYRKLKSLNRKQIGNKTLGKSSSEQNQQSAPLQNCFTLLCLALRKHRSEEKATAFTPFSNIAQN